MTNEEIQRNLRSYAWDVVADFLNHCPLPIDEKPLSTIEGARDELVTAIAYSLGVVRKQAVEEAARAICPHCAKSLSGLRNSGEDYFHTVTKQMMLVEIGETVPMDVLELCAASSIHALKDSLVAEAASS